MSTEIYRGGELRIQIFPLDTEMLANQIFIGTSLLLWFFLTDTGSHVLHKQKLMSPLWLEWSYKYWFTQAEDLVRIIGSLSYPTVFHYSLQTMKYTRNLEHTKKKINEKDWYLMDISRIATQTLKNREMNIRKQSLRWQLREDLHKTHLKVWKLNSTTDFKQWLQPSQLVLFNIEVQCDFRFNGKLGINCTDSLWFWHLYGHRYTVHHRDLYYQKFSSATFGCIFLIFVILQWWR